VPFSLVGGTAIATGRGEQLDPLQGISPLHVVLAKYGQEFVSTPWAYKTYRAEFEETYESEVTAFESRRSVVQSGEMVSAIAKHDGASIGSHLYNDFEKVVLPAHPKTAELKATMETLGGLGTLMSGSGPTVFTLTKTQEEAESIAERLKATISDPDLGVWTAQFASTGIQLDG
jgi:4-diphosphocytidyl-2-C-methyl-D-erythritol kinase